MLDLEYIQEKKKAAKESIRTFSSDERNRQMMGDEGHGEGPVYEGATYLYIRAFDGDIGVRPIPSGVTFWLSPDIELYQNGTLVDTFQPLNANTAYTVTVTITNDGDLECNLCTVDLYLCDPSIGFSVNGAQQIGILNTPIMAHSTTTVEFPFTTTATMAGHKCMFARIASLITNDYPADFVNFDTYSDRHIAQQNLDIVKQGESIRVNIDKILGTRQRRLEISLKRDETLFRKNKALQKRFIEGRQEIDTTLFKLAREVMVPLKPDIVAKPNIVAKPEIINKPNINRKNIDLPILKPVVERNIKMEEIGRLDKGRWAHPFDSGINKLKVDVPILNLKANEAVPMNLTVTDPETGKIIGGITVLVVG